MKLSYEGIGQWTATFACEQAVVGEMVKISGKGTVAPCGDGEAFCGQVRSARQGGDACAVVLGGMVSAAYTGADPALGWTGLSGNGSGGVKSDASGRSCLVVDVDAVGKIVTFAL